MKKNYLSQNLTSYPFWIKSFSSTKNKKDKFVKIFKFFLKWFKLVVYSFLFLMGLWGCFQALAEPEIRVDTTLGNGFEFGFPIGKTSDYRYDLSSNFNSQFYNFSSNNWGFQYGPFFAFFVYPGAILVIHIMYSLKNAWGGLNALLAIFILLFIIRLITLLISIRSTLQTERMSEIQGKLAEINAKYKDVKKDNISRQKKQIETQELYKKYNIKPFSIFEQLFITMPIFLIVYRVVTILRPFKAISLFTIWNLGSSPLTEIFSHFSQGGWVFIFFLLIVVPVQIISQKIPQYLAKKRNNNAKTLSSKGSEQAKRMKMTQTIMMVVLIFVVVSSPAGIGMYWFLSSLFTIAQSFIIHHFVISKKQKGISLEDKLKELGIN